ncbi:MAG TPA: DNA repair protein RecN [Armatimonadota bacterium]|nr:DNA repair protein RecN [Armatimonadota bacterium]
MLSELHITDFALVDELSVRFGPGLNVLTGETGAGKSIIIDAISAVLGMRADYDLIRTGAQRAVVQAAFDLSDAPEARAAAAEAGIESEEDLLLVTRELQASGKSQCRINGRLATVSMLRALGHTLIDVHGQHEHQSLLSVSRHLDLLDAWAGPEVMELRARFAERFRALTSLDEQIEKLTTDARDRARKVDLYQFQIQEIDAAGLRDGEEEELEAERLRLANAEKLFLNASQAYDRLRGDDALLDSLAACQELLEGLAEVDRSASSLVEPVASALYQLEDVAKELRTYRDSIEFNPERLEEVQERLIAIQHLKRKYGDTIAEILAYRKQLAAELDGLTHSEEREAELRQQREAVHAEITSLAERLTQLRYEATGRFQDEVETELAALAMEKTSFRVALEIGALGPTGTDRVEFLISPNPGEPLKPLARIASGGELSRVMLALKSILARVDRVPTLIFDEVDVGIGGRTAHVIGEKLAALGKEKQVLCVTHLPQVASRGDLHFTVRKEIQGERTVIRLCRLTDEERVDELTRMLGGQEGSAMAREHAREMLSRSSGGAER